MYKLPYLDFCLEWNEHHQITKVYRKPTCSKKIMPWTAFAPNAWKSGTLVNFIKRAHTHSSNLMEMHKELSTIKKIYGKMGYPKWFVDKIIKQTLDKIFDPKKTKKVEEIENKWLVIYLPWSGLLAGKIVESIRRVIPEEIHIRFSFAYATTKVRQALPMFKVKIDKKDDSNLSINDDENSPNRLDKLYILRSRNVVYRYYCNCGVSYIGETKRRLHIRALEHNDKNSPLTEHLQHCGSKFLYKNFKIIARNLKGSESRKKFETLYIKFYDKRCQTMNICSSSRELTIF